MLRLTCENHYFRWSGD